MVKNDLKNSKGQAHLLETIAALFIIVVALIIVINSPVTTSSPTDDFNIDQSEMIQNHLYELNNQDKFKKSFIYWNAEQEPNENNSFKKLDFVGEDYFYNVKFSCDSETYNFVSQGDPSTNNIKFNSYFLLYDDDEFDGTELADSNQFICDNQDLDSNYYNKVQVEVIIWKL